ncbi:MAG: mechanosensitive ion channel [Bacteroidales bacterium]|nr:mechanosensitive ion channel [Bacteroidales bacterium]
MTPATESIAKDFDLLKNLSLDDALSKMANSVVDFTFRLIIAIVIFYVGRFIIRKILSFIHNVLEKRKVDLSLATFVRSFVQILLYFILIVTVVGILGIETSSFLALFASAGVAIGMALSGTLQNFAGGVLILLLKPYKVGEYIETQGYAGTVNEIQMFHTVITTPDNKTILIPNGALSTSSINNYTRQPLRRVDWSVGISYGDSFDNASKAILEILNSDPRVLKEEGRMPFVGITELADSSVNLAVRAWVHSADYWSLYFDLYNRFYTELPSKGVNFPFPQLDVHLDRQ